MNISVLIPTYNSAATIEATVASALRQTLPADEIIILLDGGTDDTLARLEQFRGRVTVIEQANGGISAARNKLVKLAKGRLLAFLDSDDLWHPDYLKTQQESFLKHPEAVAFFTGHNNFYGDKNYSWPDVAAKISPERELIPGMDFFRRYNEAAGPFASMTYCCLPKAALERLGDEPFALDCIIAEDSYLLYWLSLFGPVVYASEALAAYRIRRGSISENRLRGFKSWVRVFENLEGKFAAANQPAMFELFQWAFASKRREMAKRMLGAGQISEAREQLRRSFSICLRPSSMAKSFGLLGLSFLPRSLQFAWPSDLRPGAEKRGQTATSIKGAK
jgi:glycosyltransferase involved in cell wall biosynthesis